MCFQQPTKREERNYGMYSLVHVIITSMKQNNSTGRQPLRRGFLVIALAFACFALSPQARAVCQQGCDLVNASTFLGDNALVNNTAGNENTANGAQALASNTTGSDNTATGSYALSSNTVGGNNTAIGRRALQSNSDNGGGNTAIGADALRSNTFGSGNTANGAGALFGNTSGSSNTANGWAALGGNTTGDHNTANGWAALGGNTTGEHNTANGFNALLFNTTGSFNMADGGGALSRNTTGTHNTAAGINALAHNSVGSYNIALGLAAGVNLRYGSNNIDIGNPGVLGDSSRIRIGTKGTHINTFIAGISGVAVAGGVGVVVDTNGKLGTVVSSKRFKQEIKPMDKASEAILSLEPVTFRYKHELDPNGIPQFGLVAEEVEKVNPDLVARDDKGKAYTVRYEAVNVMLLNEFLKEHRKGEQQDRKIEELEATVAKLQSAFKEQASQIQKVSEQLGMSKPAPQLAANELN
jgi:hypothetical protein